MFKKTGYTILATTSYMLGILAFFKHAEAGMSILIALGILSLLFLKKINNIFAVFLAGAFIFGVAFTDYKMNSEDLLSSLAPANAEITGRVVSIPETAKADKVRFFLNAKHVKVYNDDYDTDTKVFVSIYDENRLANKINIGDTIKVSGTLREPSTATNPAQFNYRNYLKNFNTFTVFYVYENNWSVISSPESGKWKFMQDLNLLRQKIISQHEQIIKSPNIEVLGGIVFGDDAISPPEDVKDSFIKSGLMHILAASGLNVGIIFGIWYFLFTRLRIHYKLGIVIGIFLILLYTLMTGLGPPVLRAALMLIFGLIGKLIDRDADNAALLLFVASLILFYNPAFLFDVGFQLSFIVTYGLLSFCPVIAEKTKKIPQSIAGAVYVPLIAQIVVAPIQMFYFNTFATYSLFANIASLPFVSAISFLGFTSSILAMIPKFPAIIIAIFDWIMNPIITALLKISDFFSSLPHSLINTTQCSVTQIVIYYILITLIFFLIKDGFTKKLAISLAVTFIVLLVSTIPPRNSNLEAIFFDVGNADAILLKTPDNKYIVIDTAHLPYKSGFSQIESIVYEYLKDHGIKEIEFMIITHYDADHAGGAAELLRLIKVKNAILNPVNDGSKLFKAIPEAAKEYGTNVIYPKNGQEIYRYKDGSIKIFQRTDGLDPNRKDNDSSLITLAVKGDKSMLFTGDAGINIIESLQAFLPEKINILKVGHHGANFTINEKFLKDKQVKSAVISTGNNTYGHPTPATIYTIQNSAIELLRTDADNAIKISVQKDEIVSKCYNAKKSRWAECQK